MQTCWRVHNASRLDALRDDYGRTQPRLGAPAALPSMPSRRACPSSSWRPQAGEPGWGARVLRAFPWQESLRICRRKIEDCAVIQQLCRVTPRVSLHFPWDKITDPKAVRQHAEQLGMGFDAVNSNTFQDQANQPQSYRYGSLTHTAPAVRDQAIAHNIECIQLGKMLGSKALTVWIGDGTNFPGQQQLGESLDRYLASAKVIYRGASS